MIQIIRGGDETTESWLTIHYGSRNLEVKVANYWHNIALKPQRAQFIGYLWGVPRSEKSINDIFSTSVCLETLDESPQAYSPMEKILRLIEPTA